MQTTLLLLDVDNAACFAMASLLYLVDLIVASARVTVLPEQLLGAVHRFLQAFVDAFGYEWLTPKCHWLLHLPETLGRFGRLLNCFCLERKHRWAKRYATDLQNTSGRASTSLLSEVVCHQMASLTAPGSFMFDIGLVDGRAAPKKTRRLVLHAIQLEDDGEVVVSIAKVARFSSVAICHVDDVVLLQDDGNIIAGRVQVLCDIQDIPMVIVTPFSLHYRDPDTSLAIWTVQDDYEVFEMKHILAATEYVVYPSGRVGLLLPIEHN